MRKPKFTPGTKVWFPAPYRTQHNRFIDGGTEATVLKATNIGGWYYSLRFEFSPSSLVIPASAIEVKGDKNA